MTAVRLILVLVSVTSCVQTAAGQTQPAEPATMPASTQAAPAATQPETAPAGETLGQLAGRVAAEAAVAYQASPFSALSRDYFSRFSRDPQARADEDEVLIDEQWRILLPSPSSPIAERMAGHLGEFFAQGMGLKLAIERPTETQPAGTQPAETQPAGTQPAGTQPAETQPEIAGERCIVLLESGGGAADVPGSFTLAVAPGRILIRGRDPEGLRNGIVHLVDEIGFRQAPIVARGEQVNRPRLKVRLGAVPWMGSYRDLVFMGYNAVMVSGGSLHALSTSDAIPELAVRRNPAALQAVAGGVAEARRYGLRTYCFINTRQKFAKDDPVFAAHPDLRGALTWKADGEYVLCTEHPLVRQYLSESAEGIFRAAPELDGLLFIIGGEGFYHCFMRSFGTPKGHTNCARCEALGAETVVANLCNLMAEAARRVNPDAEAVAWPYSAEHVWSGDKAQAELIKRLKPGTAIFTEIEKDEYVAKPEGVNKHLWDYSIDLIGPGERAKQQIAACRAAGIPIYMKSEPELAFEAPRLPHIPCHDRWADRAEALASCGATGAWVFPAFRANYGTSAAEINKLFWWDPHFDKEATLKLLAERIAGGQAGAYLRRAWKAVSDAIVWSPELPSYYTGPYYLGPAHPMCADPQAPLPEVFYGYYLFMAEMTDADGLKRRPTFVTSPTGNVEVFGRFYRRMEGLLKQAADEIAAARPMVPDRHRLTFEAEASPIRWFYATARTEANFYEACLLRDRLLALAAQPSRTPPEIDEARAKYERWRAILVDEKANAAAALPVVEADMRLDFYYGGDHTFPHAADMIQAKLTILDREVNEFLPSVARRCGLEPATQPAK